MEISFNIEPFETYKSQMLDNQVVIGNEIPREESFLTTVQMKKIAAVVTAVLSIIIATAKLAAYFASHGSLVMAPFVSLGFFAIAIAAGSYYSYLSDQVVDLDSSSVRKELSNTYSTYSFPYLMKSLHNRGISVKQVAAYDLLGKGATQKDYSALIVIGSVYEQILRSKDDMSDKARENFDASVLTTLEEYHGKLATGGA